MIMKISTNYFEKWIDYLVPWLLSSGIRILFITLISFIIYKIARKIISKVITVSVIRKDSEYADEEEQRAKTLIGILSIALKIIIVLVACLMIATEFGIEIGPILAGAGVVGIALGFGGQYLIKDVISGLFIILENQYRIHDFINIAGLTGKVENISLRMTTLRDLDGNIHHVPHGEIKTVSNFSKTFSRINLDIGVGYGSDMNKVRDVVNQIGQDLANDAYWQQHIISPPEFVRVQELGDSAVVIKILGDTKPSQQWAVAGEMRKRLYEAFNDNSIEIPFPQRTVHIVNK